jgi:DNA-binding beta-propeller fold protein YncE
VKEASLTFRLLLPLFATFVLATSPVAEILPQITFGSDEEIENRLSAPMGLSIGYGDHLYVADSGNNRIVVFDSTGAVLSRIGFAGSGEGRFLEPTDVAAGEGLHIYILDTGNERIQVFDRYDQFREVIFSRDEETVGIPVGLEADPFGRVYVADAEEDLIRIFRSFTGEKDITLGGYGTEPGRFRQPADVAVDRERRIYVTDKENGRVQVFNSLGGLLYQFGGGEGRSRLSSPTGIAVDRWGTVFVADSGNRRVAVFRGGKLIDEIVSAPDGSSFRSPRGVAVDETGRVYVSDAETHLVHLYRYRFSSHAR